MTELLVPLGGILQLLALASILVLPVGVLVASWSKFQRVAWDWAVVLFVLMSTAASFILDFLVPRFWTAETESDQAVNSVVAHGGIVGLAVGGFYLFAEAECELSEVGRRWRRVRWIGAGLVSAFVVDTYLTRLLGDMGMLLLIPGFAIFLLGHFGVYRHRPAHPPANEADADPEPNG